MRRNGRPPSAGGVAGHQRQLLRAAAAKTPMGPAIEPLMPPANAYSLSRKGGPATWPFVTGFSISQRLGTPVERRSRQNWRFGGRPDGRTAGRAPEWTSPLRYGSCRASAPASTGGGDQNTGGASDRAVNAACQCLLVIKERRSSVFPRRHWVLNKPAVGFPPGGLVLTGLALRRASRRSHGRPCAGMDVPPPLWVLQGISASFYERRRPKHQWGQR